MRILTLCIIGILMSIVYGGEVVSNEDVIEVASPQVTEVEQIDSHAESVHAVSEEHPTSFWQKVKNGFVSTGKYTWKGIKWTWRGICKGAFYMKEGTISVLEKSGLKAKSTDEVDTHEVVLREASKTLTESRTRRELRKEKFERNQ